VQQGREPQDVDFCSMTMDGTLDSDILQQQIQTVVRQRHEILQMEIELKAQIIARSEMMEIRSNFDAQLKEHANNASKFQVCIQTFPQVLQENHTFRCLVESLYT
jgi:hypothetical protein